MHDATRTITAAVITRALVAKRAKRGFTLGNYVVPGWGWEADAWHLDGLGFAHELEVKVSAADFARDKSKSRVEYKAANQFGHREAYMASKFSLLQAADVRGPNRFWFCAPAGLILRELLPDFAGLIEVSVANGKLVENVVRAAPLLHTTPVSDSVRADAGRVCHQRLHAMGAGVLELSSL